MTRDQNYNHFNQIEDKLLDENRKKNIAKHKMKVSGKSVFKLEKIMKDKTHDKTNS